MGLKSFVIGMLFGVCLVGCVGAFPYHYYGLSEDVDFSRGKLLGPKESDDLEFTDCQPGPQIKHPCVVMKADRFFQLKQDYETIRSQLDSCQRGAK